MAIADSPPRHGRALLLLLGGALAAGCVGAAANHETVADEAYAEGRFADALVEYRLALTAQGSSADLHVKAAAAAMHVGDLQAAVEEFVGLAEHDGTSRVEQAADGLARVADAAIERKDQIALAQALEGLQAVAPGRALGAFAPQVAASLGDLARSPEALSVLMYAAAAAPDARGQDSAMYAYGSLLRRLGRCREATQVLESLVRRQRDRQVTNGARAGLIACALFLGRSALDNGEPSAAEQWYELAATRGGETPEGRMAYLGLGDVRFALGDIAGAVDAYEQARAGLAPGDSVYAIVGERLNVIAAAGARIF